MSAQSGTTACFSITSTEKTKEVYPYDFKLSLTYTLNDNGLFMDYVVDNPETRDIAYCIGAHPGFVMPLEDGEKFSDYRLEFEQEEHCLLYTSYDCRAKKTVAHLYVGVWPSRKKSYKLGDYM